MLKIRLDIAFTGGQAYTDGRPRSKKETPAEYPRSISVGSDLSGDDQASRRVVKALLP